MTGDDDEVIDVQASAGALDPVILLLREFLHRSGAVRAVAAVDRGPLPAAVVDVAQLSPIEVSEDDRSYVLPHAIELDVPEPLPVPDVRQLPRFDVDTATGEVASPIGGMGHYADAVRGLSDALHGRSVVVVTWATSDPDTPLSLSVRAGEPLLVTLGEESYDLPPAP